MVHDQYLVRRSSLKFREQPEQWNIWKGSLVFPDGIFQQRFVFHFFKAIFDTLWWPASVTAKPKTSRQNQKPSGKPNTSQQKQNSFGFGVGICFCHEEFGFCCCVVFDFAVRSLVLPWGFWFCRAWARYFVFALRFKIHVYRKRQTSDSSWEFLRIGNKQIKTVQNDSYE